VMLSAASLLDAFGAPERLAIWCMLETPRGILYVREIAAASPRLAALVLGTSDLTKDLHALATQDRLPLITSLSHAILAARANGLAILDGVHLDLADDEGLTASCRQGREFGFDGKTLRQPQWKSNGRGGSLRCMPKPPPRVRGWCSSTAG